MSESRRKFLTRIARGAAYAAPVVVSLSAPDGLLGQGQSQNSQKGGMGKGMSRRSIVDPSPSGGTGGIGTLRPPPASTPESGTSGGSLSPSFPLRPQGREE